MIRLAALAIILWSGVASSSSAQSPELIDFLGAAYNAEDTDQLAKVLAERPSFAGTEAIWREAFIIGRTELAGEAAGRAAIVRLVEAAVQLSQGRSASASLDRLDQPSLEAMRLAIGFPGDDDLLAFLFAREPSLRDEFEFERYSIVRMILPDQSGHLIRERSDRPFLGLVEEFSARIVRAENDPVFVAPGERARTRHLNLAAIGDLVVASKAYQAAERVEGEDRTYALMIAADAIDRAAKANSKDFRLTTYRANWLALQSLRDLSKQDGILKSERERREFSIARTAFFARQFSDAIDAYRFAPVPDNDPYGQLWAAWGVALSQFAQGVEMSFAFGDVVQRLGVERPEFARMFQLLVAHANEVERMSVDRLSEWESRIEEILSSDDVIESDEIWINFNQDFLRILEAIGRPDIATRYLMAEIERIDRTSSTAWREQQMLHWLAPFVSDLCKTISFQMSAASGWELRQTPGYNRYLDFLHSIGPDGELVVPGQVILVLDEPGPYGATSPDEDCATTLAVYGSFSSDLFGLAFQPKSNELDKSVEAVERWVVTSMERDEPAPSIVPYLKLIWIEWFSQAFETLKQPGFTIDQFEYRPLATSEFATRARVESLLSEDISQSDQRQHFELFLTIRAFLESRYP